MASLAVSQDAFGFQHRIGVQAVLTFKQSGRRLNTGPLTGREGEFPSMPYRNDIAVLVDLKKVDIHHTAAFRRVNGVPQKEIHGVFGPTVTPCGTAGGRVSQTLFQMLTLCFGPISLHAHGSVGIGR